MGLFASFSIHRCPRCGEPVTVSGIKIDNEPELHPVDCENCKARLQARRDPATGRLVIEPRTEQ